MPYNCNQGGRALKLWPPDGRCAGGHECGEQQGARGSSRRGRRGGLTRPPRSTARPPATLAGGNQCSGSERYPGMWEVPLYQAGGNLMVRRAAQLVSA